MYKGHARGVYGNRAPYAVRRGSASVSFIFKVKTGDEIIREVGFIFFFSSRRRHTRLQGDWSSDVCSSDLNTASTTRQYHLAQRAQDLGWPAHLVVVIDQDQGRSGVSSAGRDGFEYLIAEVGLGRAGAEIGRAHV